jgi:hypothetical protein
MNPETVPAGSELLYSLADCISIQAMRSMGLAQVRTVTENCRTEVRCTGI